MANINIEQQKNSIGVGQILGTSTIKRRSRYEIIADILSVARGGARPTRIMYKSNLSFERKKRYLNRLLDAGLIAVEVKSPLVYKTTELGDEWLGNYRKVKLV